MIAWNSRMALDARQYLFLKEVRPERLWRVTNDDGKEFVLKLYRVEEEMESVRSGYYVESKYVSEQNEFDPSSPESGTEWAFLETSVENLLNHYPEVEELSSNPS